jgi:hypothetical protein
MDSRSIVGECIGDVALIDIRRPIAEVNGVFGNCFGSTLASLSVSTLQQNDQSATEEPEITLGTHQRDRWSNQNVCAGAPVISATAAVTNAAWPGSGAQASSSISSRVAGQMGSHSRRHSPGETSSMRSERPIALPVHRAGSTEPMRVLRTE